MKLCPNCGSTVDESFKFCPSCGNNLQNVKTEDINLNNQAGSIQKIVFCDVCGEETSTGKGACESCGALLTGKEKLSDSSPAEMSGPGKETSTGSPQTSAEKNRPAVKPTPKGKPVKGDTRMQQKKAPAVPVKDTSAKQPVSTVQIVVLIVSLLAAGLLILDITGVFDTAPKNAANNTRQQNQAADSSGISLEQINTINALENEVRNDSSDNNKVLKLAHLLNDSGFDERAIKYYNMYLRKNPKDADAIVDMGVCYFKLKDYIRAKQVMKQGLRINPAHQIASFNLGIVNLSAGNIDSAKIWWQKAIDMNPENDIGKKAKELLISH